MTLIWKTGERLNVWAEPNGTPKRLVWREVVHPVLGVLKYGRLDRGWWRLHVWRDSYKLEMSDGLVVLIYHDLLTDRWYLQRWYD